MPNWKDIISQGLAGAGTGYLASRMMDTDTPAAPTGTPAEIQACAANGGTMLNGVCVDQETGLPLTPRQEQPAAAPMGAQLPSSRVMASWHPVPSPADIAGSVRRRGRTGRRAGD